jgi:GTP-dependent dephospho-CoA kinase
LKITESLRETLKKPLGVVIKDTCEIRRGCVLVAVGDLASKRLIADGLRPHIIVYDGKTKRQDIGVSEEITGYPGETYLLDNPAGELAEEAMPLFERLYRKNTPSKVFVGGEEDLTALAAISLAPAGACIVYGQPDEGLVMVEADEEAKNKVNKIIKEMN